MRKLVDAQLDDPTAERVRRSTAEVIAELQDMMPKSVVIPGVVLANAVETPITHKLGRAPRFVQTSVVSGAATPGVINEFRGKFSSGAPITRSSIIVLRADGFGAPITVDVKVE